MRYKLTISIILTVLLLGGSIYETIFVENIFNDFNVMLDEVLTQEEFDIARINEIGEWWNKKSKQLALTIPHSQINEVTFTYKELVGAVEAEDFPSARALLTRIKEYSTSLCDTYKFSFGNVI